jgi:hypothetical protein
MQCDRAVFMSAASSRDGPTHLAGVEDYILVQADRRPFLGLCFKNLGICELPHVGAAKKYANPYRQAQRDVEGMQMRAWMAAGIAVVVAIGLMWSVAAMSSLVPVDGSDSAAISRPAE